LKEGGLSPPAVYSLGGNDSPGEYEHVVNRVARVGEGSLDCSCQTCTALGRKMARKDRANILSIETAAVPPLLE
jgi:hypothetical protein